MANLNARSSSLGATQSYPLSASGTELYAERVLHVVDSGGTERILALDRESYNSKRTTGSKLYYHDGTRAYKGALTVFSDYTPSITHSGGYAYIDSSGSSTVVYEDISLSSDGDSIDRTYDLSNSATYGLILGANRYASGIVPRRDSSLQLEPVSLVDKNIFASFTALVKRGQSVTMRIYFDGVIVDEITDEGSGTYFSTMYAAAALRIDDAAIPVIRFTASGGTYHGTSSVSFSRLSNIES